MRWGKKKTLDAINDDIDEARRLREEARNQRAELRSDEGIISAVVQRRQVDPFGEEVQITFTRRTA
jgi:hypothetical protein